jgi:hypothetical protein
MDGHYTPITRSGAVARRRLDTRGLPCAVAGSRRLGALRTISAAEDTDYTDEYAATEGQEIRRLQTSEIPSCEDWFARSRPQAGPHAARAAANMSLRDALKSDSGSRQLVQHCGATRRSRTGPRVCEIPSVSSASSVAAHSLGSDSSQPFCGRRQRLLFLGETESENRSAGVLVEKR